MRRILTIAATALFLALGACQTTGGSQPTDPASVVFSAKTSYAAALSVAVRYANLPRCGKPTSPPICSDPSVVLQLRKADEVASVALDQAEAMVRTPNVNPGLAATAVQSAVGAVKVLQQVVVTYGLK